MRNHKANRDRVLDPKEHFVGAASAARENVLEMRDAAKDLARSQLQRLSAEVASLRDRVVANVEERPVKSVLFALGAGLLLGVFIGRR
ncbi:MAG: DUF883 domain-containing protein [Planctomycetes bacterium]|nr:DUF883 domain-containing protein [Planctomycetota bacterium]